MNYLIKKFSTSSENNFSDIFVKLLKLHLIVNTIIQKFSNQPEGSS
jgi:hypothetical protein